MKKSVYIRTECTDTNLLIRKKIVSGSHEPNPVIIFQDIAEKFVAEVQPKYNGKIVVEIKQASK
jgi:hypothetical protein